MKLFSIAVLVLGLISGCSIGRSVSHTPVESAIQTKLPISVRVDNFEDAREGAPSRVIGHIAETVYDIAGNELKTDQDAALLVTHTLREKFAAVGYIMVAEGPADFIVSGTLRKLRLDVSKRDELELVIEAQATDPSQRSVWTGRAEKNADRFAGVAGNTRDSLMRYLDSGLSQVSEKVVMDFTSVLHERMPGAFAKQSRSSGNLTQEDQRQMGGVGKITATPPATNVTVMPGRLTIRTTPGRARVVVDDIYQGLTPLDLEQVPGVHQVLIRMPGFRDNFEQVAVRTGETTEYEINLEKLPEVSK